MYMHIYMEGVCVACLQCRKFPAFVILPEKPNALMCAVSVLANCAVAEKIATEPAKSREVQYSTVYCFKIQLHAQSPLGARIPLSRI